MGDVWRGLEVVEAATRVGTEMLVSVDNREFEWEVSKMNGSALSLFLGLSDILLSLCIYIAK